MIIICSNDIREFKIDEMVGSGLLKQCFFFVDPKKYAYFLPIFWFWFFIFWRTWFLEVRNSILFCILIPCLLGDSLAWHQYLYILYFKPQKKIWKKQEKCLILSIFLFFSTSNPSIWIGSGVSFIILSNWHYPGLHGHNKFFTSRGLEKKLHDFSFFRIFFSHKYIFHNKKKYGKFLKWVMV